MNTLATRMILGSLAVLLVGIAGKAAAASPSAAPSPYDFADPQTLIKKANALAESELAKLAAAEMIYRDVVSIHCLRADLSSGIATESWMKLYRQFTGYKVLDIERTNSVLTPIKYTIRFDCNRIGTRSRIGQRGDEKLLQEMENDSMFISHGPDRIIREYLCTAQGDPIELESPVIERANYFFSNGKDANGDHWLEDPRKPPRSY